MPPVPGEMPSARRWPRPGTPRIARTRASSRPSLSSRRGRPRAPPAAVRGRGTADPRGRCRARAGAKRPASIASPAAEATASTTREQWGDPDRGRHEASSWPGHRRPRRRGARGPSTLVTCGANDGDSATTRAHRPRRDHVAVGEHDDVVRALGDELDVVGGHDDAWPSAASARGARLHRTLWRSPGPGSARRAAPRAAGSRAPATGRAPAAAPRRGRAVLVVGDPRRGGRAATGCAAARGRSGAPPRRSEVSRSVAVGTRPTSDRRPAGDSAAEVRAGDGHRPGRPAPAALQRPGSTVDLPAPLRPIRAVTGRRRGRGRRGAARRPGRAATESPAPPRPGSSPRPPL